MARAGAYPHAWSSDRAPSRTSTARAPRSRAPSHRRRARDARRIDASRSPGQRWFTNMLGNIHRVQTTAFLHRMLSFERIAEKIPRLPGNYLSRREPLVTPPAAAQGHRSAPRRRGACAGGPGAAALLQSTRFAAQSSAGRSGKKLSGNFTGGKGIGSQVITGNYR